MTAKLRVVLGVMAAAALASGTRPAPAQQQQTASVIVTVVPKKNADATLDQSRLKAQIDGKDAQVRALKSATQAPMQLMILIDDASVTTLGSQMDDIKNFLGALPPNVYVAIAYMQNGAAVVATRGFVGDHREAAAALRLPFGTHGVNASPYFAISDAAKKWPAPESAEGRPAGPVRREILAITDGVDRYYGLRFDPNNPYFQNAISDAQKAGILVDSIYFRNTGRLDRTFYAAASGQNYLGELSRQTGGHSYNQLLSNPVSFAPYLDELLGRLKNQYELSLMADPRVHERGLATLKLKPAGKGISLEYPTATPLSKVPE